MRTYVRLGLLLAAVLAVAVVADGATPAYAWGYPAALNTNAATDSGHDEYPQVATDGGGNWVAVWFSFENLGGGIGTDADILVARSTDNGATWTAPAALNTNATTDSGWDGYPQVTTDGGGNWLAVWMSGDSLGGTIGSDYDILVARSTDNGATWTAPAALNTNAATDAWGDWRPQVTTDGGGNWLAVWYSREDLGGTIGTDRDILVARSTNNGATWSDPAPLNANAATDSGEDYFPQVATDGGGNWLAVWNSNENLGGTIGTDRDILVAQSTDNGASWTAPAALNANAATDSGWDSAPQVTTDGGGNWLAVWHSQDDLGGTIGTDFDILVARSTDNGATWTAPAALNTNAGTDSGSDLFLQVATDGGGNWLAVWQSQDDLGGSIGMDWDILAARSTDNGATWTAPAALNTNAATDSEDDYVPQVANDGGGNWVTVWESHEDLGGTIGTDADILYATGGNTPDGTGVTVSLSGGLSEVGGLQVTFSTVTEAGSTTVVVSGAGPPPPTGYKIVGIAGQPTYYDIDTTASFEGALTVCIRYDETQVAGPESRLKLMHRVDSGFENITTSVDTANNIICGETTTLSFFAIMEPIAAVGGIVEMLTDGSDAPASAADGSGSSAPPYAAVAGAMAAAALAITAGAWYARRRWLR